VTRGTGEELSSDPIYIDANPFIYAIEGHEVLARPLELFFQRLRQQRAGAVTSELTLAEVLPKANVVQRRLYLDLIVWSGIFDLRAVTREILIETADFRRAAGRSGKRTMPALPDAIHGVTAIRAGCKRMLTADSRIRLPEGFEVVEATAAAITQLAQEIA
jgi:predicted nucleic acid-binding protein